MPSVTTLLVANRGEIARRIIRTAAEMGIRTVAVYAKGDRRAPFVHEADTAVALGGSTATDSYLNIGKLLEAARRTGADALHPGYGFLSERADFAAAVLDAGLTWIGPPPAAIASMGNKAAAKRQMIDAGVPVLPSVELDRTGDADPASVVGFPLLVKAASGGGGRGMRLVERRDDLAEAIAAAQHEARSAFGDDELILERCLTKARHVEVQILADSHGNIIHCFERECSVQRRHQKIIEECPSPAVDDELRARICGAAITAAKAISYENVGTVEFLLDEDGDFYFLEMNTRLQVEHPVTEEVTGLDLVREQIAIARGERLSRTQADISIRGHAIEARLYAEDPRHDFRPDTGSIDRWQPCEQPRLRFDSGIEAGSEVGIDFDPMLAKVIAHAPTRSEAVLRLALGLERTGILGPVTNRQLLIDVLRHPEFLAGMTTTDFIERTGLQRGRPPTPAETRNAAIAVAVVSQAQHQKKLPVLSTLPSGWRNSVMPPQEMSFRLGTGELTLTYRALKGNVLECSVSGWTGRAIVQHVDEDRVVFELDGEHIAVKARECHGAWRVQAPGTEVRLESVERFPVERAEEVPGGLVAPMPGVVLGTLVDVGASVEKGQVLILLEAMKMEHRIVAPAAGVITEILVTPGCQVSPGEVLVVIDEEETFS